MFGGGGGIGGRGHAGGEYVLEFELQLLRLQQHPEDIGTRASRVK